ncbi:MAG: hypothetical protein V3U31_05965 [Dehalococcoidia bacterium]
MNQSRDRGTAFKLAIIWLAILLLGSFYLTARQASEPLNMIVLPQAPREGEPIIATFKLGNPTSEAVVTRYQFYANGKLINEGVTTIDADTGKTYRYAYANPLQMGERLSFTVTIQSEQGDYERALSSPPYPPQVWSSFVSFASFSTSVMSSMSSMTYYGSTFGNDTRLNMGVIAALVLIALLIFLEMTHSVVEGREVAVLGRLRVKFSTLTWILFILFMSVSYTKTVLMVFA